MALDAIAAVSAPTPVRPAAPAGTGAPDGHSFAELLGRSREAAHAPADPPGDSRPDDDDADKTADDATPKTPAHAARRADRAPAPRHAERPAKAEPTDGEAPKTDTAKADDPTATADPALPPWLAALHTTTLPPADASPPGGAPKADVAATAALQAGSTSALAAPSAKPSGATDAKADADAGAVPVQQALIVEADAARDEAAPAAAVTERTAAPRVGDLAQPLAAPAPLAAPERASEPAPVAPPAATLATPVESPEFAGALGVQVSVFAREGVQQAELQLNPVEMGPVSVQIALDGNQARVHFGAEVAATRQAIEASLPELAAALRDAGFTLSGGGVSQQRGGRGEGGADSGPRDGRRVASNGSVQSVTPGLAGSAAVRRVAAGGVDLYA